jgi:8-oxo-dGTP pyrophosphatase MutT (NUDIX family)
MKINPPLRPNSKAMRPALNNQEHLPPESLKKWELLRSDTVIKDRWITLRADTCRTADGHEVKPYYILENPDWTVILASNTQGEMILVQQYRHGIQEVVNEFPAGNIDAGEHDIEESARREMREETGYTGGEWKYVRSMPVNPARQTAFCHVVLATGLKKTHEIMQSSSEEIRMFYKTPQELEIMIQRGEFNHPHHIAAWSLYKNQFLK